MDETAESTTQMDLTLDLRHRRILRELWHEGSLSRWELHRRLDLRPNDVGNLIGALIKMGLVRECPAKPSTGGRPRVPVEIDPVSRCVLGVAISPGKVEACRVSLLGKAIGEPMSETVNSSSRMISAARNLVRQMVDDNTLFVGLSVTGFVDPSAKLILLSSAVPESKASSLTPVYEAAGNRLVFLENDMHAMAARWMLTRRPPAVEDVVLASIGDGRLGAALLIDGKPNQGCAIGANELGHVRFPADTEMCYCGHMGCMERICSSEYLASLGGPITGNLLERASRMDSKDKAMQTVLSHVAMGLSNTVNFVRPNRLVLAGDLLDCQAFHDALVESVRAALLPQIADHVQIDVWEKPLSVQPAETAAWLALASMYCEGWTEPRVTMTQ